MHGFGTRTARHPRISHMGWLAAWAWLIGCSAPAGAPGPTADAGGGGQDVTPAACAPVGRSECAGPTKVAICKASGTIEEESCPAATPSCLSGACVACSPGERKCVGNAAVVCNAEGAWGAANSCGTSPCAEGNCVVGGCIEGAVDCDGKTPKKCVGGVFQAGPTCATSCQAGACTQCVPKDTECVGNGLRTCDDSGNWGEARACPVRCEAGACSVDCAPNDTRCNGKRVETCSSTGTWDTSDVCPYACARGACTGTCDSADSSIRCAPDGVGRRHCNAEGNWQTDDTCPVRCEAGACATNCTPLAASCAGRDRMVCDATGRAETIAETCDYVCEAGACGAPTYECDWSSGLRRVLASGYQSPTPPRFVVAGTTAYLLYSDYSNQPYGIRSVAFDPSSAGSPLATTTPVSGVAGAIATRPVAGGMGLLVMSMADPTTVSLGVLPVTSAGLQPLVPLSPATVPASESFSHGTFEVLADGSYVYGWTTLVGTAYKRFAGRVPNGGPAPAPGSLPDPLAASMLAGIMRLGSYDYFVETGDPLYAKYHGSVLRVPTSAPLTEANATTRSMLDTASGATPYLLGLARSLKADTYNVLGWDVGGGAIGTFGVLRVGEVTSSTADTFMPHHFTKVYDITSVSDIVGIGGGTQWITDGSRDYFLSYGVGNGGLQLIWGDTKGTLLLRRTDASPGTTGVLLAGEPMSDVTVVATGMTPSLQTFYVAWSVSDDKSPKTYTTTFDELTCVRTK